ncbi:MAG: hypothetical protein V1784_04495 [bacterium]
MHTLHDFMLLTKGQEYLIAVTFLLLFCIFWMLIDKKKKRHTG